MRSARLEHGLWSVAVMAVGGAALAVIIFLATSTTPLYRYLGPLCAQTVSDPGFDPWTGQPHGRIYTCPGELLTSEAPHELVGRWVVLLPDGFAVGAAIRSGSCSSADGSQVSRDQARPNSVPSERSATCPRGDHARALLALIGASLQHG
jgi:hypothetical protein